MNSSRSYGSFAALLGLWVIYSVISDSDFFFNHSKAKFFERIWGRKGNRLFYGILGIIIFLIGILGSTGLVCLGD